MGARLGARHLPPASCSLHNSEIRVVELLFRKVKSLVLGYQLVRKSTRLRPMPDFKSCFTSVLCAVGTTGRG